MPGKGVKERIGDGLDGTDWKANPLLGDVCFCTGPCVLLAQASADSCLFEKHSPLFAWIEAVHVPLGPFLFVRVKQCMILYMLQLGHGSITSPNSKAEKTYKESWV